MADANAIFLPSALFVIGGLIGFFAAFRDGTLVPTGTSGQLARVKGIAWIALSGGGLGILNPKIVGADANSSMAPYAGYYLAGAAVGIVAAYATTTIVILLPVISLNRRIRPALRLSPMRLLGKFLADGWKACQDAFDTEKRVAETCERELEAAEDAREREERLSAHQFVLTLTHSVLGLLTKGSTATPDERAGQIVAACLAVELLLKAYAKELRPAEAEIRVTLMRYHPSNLTDDSFKSQRKFGLPEGIDCVGDLLLIHPEQINEECIIIPVTGGDDPSLPGAPLAFKSGQPTVLDIKENGFLKLNSRLPGAEIQKIQRYFASDHFKPIRSVSSFCVMHGGQKVGVLNIETSLDGIIGRDENAARDIHNRLQLLLALIGAIL